MDRAYNSAWRVCSKHPWRSNIWKKGRGKNSTTILKASHQKHRADSYTAIKKWLGTIPDGKLPTNQKIEGLKRYDWAQKYNQYIWQYQHTCYLKHAPPDGIIVGCSYIFLA